MHIHICPHEIAVMLMVIDAMQLYATQAVTYVRSWLS